MASLIPSLQDLDPDGQRLPVKLDATTNGEFAPIPLNDSLHYANHLAREWAGELARKLGRSRRAFLTSLCGTASTLLAFNAAHARAGRDGGFFEIANDAKLDAQLAGVRARQAGIHLRCAGSFRESDRRLDETPAARREAIADAEDAV